MKIRFSSDPLVAHETNGLAVRYAESKRAIASWRWRVLVVLVLAPLLIFLARLLYSAVWADMPGFVALEETVLRLPVAGHIVRTARIGEQVNAGDIIAEVRNEILEKEYSLLLDNQQKTRAEILRTTGRSARPSDRQSMIEAQQAHALNVEQLILIKQLANQGAATRAEVNAAEAAAASTQRGLRAEVQRIATSTPAQLERSPDGARLTELVALRESQKIRATEKGVVAQVFGKQGEWLGVGAEVATLRLERPPRIEVFVDPSWARFATVNRWATVNFLDGYSHRARVREVKMQAQRLPSDRANPLTVRHHSVVVLLEPVEALPDSYKVNVLPVNVQFDRDFTPAFVTQGIARIKASGDVQNTAHSTVQPTAQGKFE